jgi:rhodanese-related sulfurtransferase
LYNDTIADEELKLNMTKRTWLSAVVLAVLSLAVAACGRAPAKTGPLAKNEDGYVDITVEQLAEMMENKDFTLVNVHIPYEGDLPQTGLSIPFDEIEANLDRLPDRNAPIVLYCRSGSMSTSAAGRLAALGHTNVMELDGGMRAWAAAGYELVRQ